MNNVTSEPAEKNTTTARGKHFKAKFKERSQKWKVTHRANKFLKEKYNVEFSMTFDTREEAVKFIQLIEDQNITC